MAVWCILPVKPLALAKSRLSNVLSVAEREALSRELFINTLQTINQVSGIERTLVVSRDTAALALAREYGAYTVTESGSPLLNQALGRATVVATSFKAHAVLVLPTDLPFITPEDVKSILAYSDDVPSVAIVSNREGNGTNALLVSPPGLIRYAYGVPSFEPHVEQARATGASVHVLHLPNIQFDLDWPADLVYYRKRKAQESVTPQQQPHY